MNEDKKTLQLGDTEVTLERMNFAEHPGLADKVVVYKDGMPWDVVDAEDVELAIPENDVPKAIPEGETPVGTGFEVMPLKSVNGGTFNVNAGDRFVNVHGSSGDDYPTPTCRSNNWKAFWEAATGLVANACVAAGSAGIICNAPIYGGHVVAPGNPVRPAPGTNHVVFIVPICNAHNNWRNDAVMAATFATTGVWLNNYHQ